MTTRDNPTPTQAKLPLLLIGASGHAKVVSDVIERQGRYEIAGVVSTHVPASHAFENHRVIESDDEIAAFCEAYDVRHALVAIGDNWTRGAVATRIRSAVPQIQFVVATHPDASVARSAVIGNGTVVMAGAVLNPYARIGEHCIVNSRASVDHDCVIGDFASIAPGAVLGGGVTVGAYSAISIGATITHGRTVGDQTVIGAGAVVLCDIPSQSVAYGIPARVVRARQPGDRYL